MALTKVKLIADGTIVQSHLNASHGITTADIGEGSNLYYTDARARAAVSVSGNALSYNSSTGVITSNFEESPTFTGNVIIDGTLGIGISPNEKLTVNGNIESLDTFILKNSGGHKWQQLFSTNDFVIRYNNTSSWYERMRIDSSGNVMMGKNSQSGNAALTVKSMAGGNTGLILIEGDTTNDGHGLYATTDNKFVITRFTNGSYSDNFVMDSSGNVGIGTTTPGTFYPGNHNLVVGDGNADSAITVYANPSNTSYLLFADGTSGSSSYTAQVRYVHSTNHMEFATNNSTSAKMTLDDNGNLGIGETNPASNLVVRSDSAGGRGGEITILNYATNTIGNEAALNFGLENSTYAGDVGNAQIKALTTASNAASDMVFSTWNGGSFGERMRIGSSGDVLINTNGKFLQGRRNTGSVVIDMIGFGAGTDNLQIKGGTSGGANAISFYDTNGFLGTFYNSNFGIGTTSPLYKTQINVTGNGETALAFMNSAVTADGNGSTNIRFVSASNAQWANASYSAYDHIWYGNGSERMRIDSSGRVFINSGQSWVETFMDKGLRIKGSRAGTILESSGTLATHVMIAGSNSNTAVHINHSNAGHLSFYQYSAGKETLRLHESGGITFNGDTAAANALDDYEEGTWTPDVHGSTTRGTVSYQYRSGSYTKIGNRVWCRFGFKLSSISGATGRVRVDGLPFVSRSYGSYQEPNFSVSTGLLATTANAYRARMFVVNSSSYLEGRISVNTDTIWNISDFGGDEWIILAFHYETHI